MRAGWLLMLVTSPLLGQAGLQREIRTIAQDARGRVEVACALPGTALNCDVDAHARPPMQSVFKLPLTMAVLHLAETKGWEIDRPVRFLPADLLPKGSYSPLQDKYPQAGVDVPLRELLRLAVSLSDNAAADVLLRLLGGPEVLNQYVASLGVKGFQQKDTEGAMHRNLQLQYRNWFEPAGAVMLLGRLRDRSPLQAEDTRLLLGWMAAAPGGAERIKGMLPPGTMVMHKTGSSDTLAGVTAATNDIGLIVLPDGRQLALAVFVTDSHADDKTRDAVIARIAKAVYDAALSRP
jgi:beta-lactamase class A